jgi:ABC-type Co2+ transport system permease subunit
MSIIGVWSGYFIFTLIKKIMPKKKPSIVIASALAAFISVPMAAAGFVLQYALGGTATFSITTVLGAMIGTHVLIGIGEALITGLTVSAVLATRPDLVFGYKGAKQDLEIRTNS